MYVGKRSLFAGEQRNTAGSSSAPSTYVCVPEWSKMLSFKESVRQRTEGSIPSVNAKEPGDSGFFYAS